jgi:hypothetical protein
MEQARNTVRTPAEKIRQPILSNGIVNFLGIAELFLRDSKGKWGMNPNAARRSRHEKG